MNRIRVKETLLVSSIALALSACGGDSVYSPLEKSSGESSTEAYQLKNLPAQRSIEIPKSLLTKRAESNARALSRSVTMSGASENAEIGDGTEPAPFGPDGDWQNVSFGYLMIKGSAFAVELSRLEQEREVLMLDAVWDDIKSRCDGTALGEACSIPEKEISLNVTEALVKANDEINKRIDDLYESQFGDLYGTGGAVSGGNPGVNIAAVDPLTMPNHQDMGDDSVPPEDYQVMPEPQEVDGVVIYDSPEDVDLPIDEPWVEPQPDFVAGEVIPLGAISYTQFSVDEDFQYEVEIDPYYMDPVSITAKGDDGDRVEFIGSSVVADERFFVTWSEDEKRVNSGFRYEDDLTSYAYTFIYSDQGDEKIVKIHDKNSFDMGDEFGKGGYSSTISLSEKESDPDGMINIVFNMNNYTPEFVSNTSSKGRVSDDGGFLRTEGTYTDTFDGEKNVSVFNTEEIFDGEGNLLKYRWCDTACDQDKNWKDGGMNWLPIPMDEPFEEFDFEESEFYMDDGEFEQIESSFYTVSGLEKKGEYIIVSEKISGNEFNDVFENIIGGGMVDDQGSDIYYWSEEGQFDAAIVYLIIFDEEGFIFQYEEISGVELTLNQNSEPLVMMPVEPGHGIGDGAGPPPMMGDMPDSDVPMVSPSMM